MNEMMANATVRRAACEVALTVLETSSSGRHKFKVRSITVTNALLRDTPRRLQSESER